MTDINYKLDYRRLALASGYYLFSNNFIMCTTLMLIYYSFNSFINRPLKDIFVGLSGLSFGSIVLLIIAIYIILIWYIISRNASPRPYLWLLHKKISLLYLINILFIISVGYCFKLFAQDNFILTAVNNTMLSSSILIFLIIRFLLLKRYILKYTTHSNLSRINILTLLLTIKNIFYLGLFIFLIYYGIPVIIIYIASVLIHIVINRDMEKICGFIPYPKVGLLRIKNSIIGLTITVFIVSTMVIVFQNRLNNALFGLGTRIESVLSSPAIPTIKPR